MSDEDDLVTPDIVVRADETNVRMGDDAGLVVRSLVSGLDRQRAITRWLIVSILLDLMLTFGLFFFSLQTSEQQNQIVQNAHQEYATCLANNTFRKKNRVLWEQVLDLPPGLGVPLLPKALAQRNAKIRGFLDVAYKLRNCKGR